MILEPQEPDMSRRIPIQDRNRYGKNELQEEERINED
jgi:hypothetical protein